MAILIPFAVVLFARSLGSPVPYPRSSLSFRSPPPWFLGCLGAPFLRSWRPVSCESLSVLARSCPWYERAGEPFSYWTLRSRMFIPMRRSEMEQYRSELVSVPVRYKQKERGTGANEKWDIWDDRLARAIENLVAKLYLGTLADARSAIATRDDAGPSMVGASAIGSSPPQQCLAFFLFRVHCGHPFDDSSSSSRPSLLRKAWTGSLARREAEDWTPRQYRAIAQYFRNPRRYLPEAMPQATTLNRLIAQGLMDCLPDLGDLEHIKGKLSRSATLLAIRQAIADIENT
ncbi:hypothetical protein HD553DRAFT_187141 [Filobasidium floriforme]|uniref:uncharacterized protein n=1 Tax=Filobasidium floriforme TaxID=5210 RepID=UPI001E8E97D3|nr:uncharacterized protein HD553DRAFT_187141 [Filobasidium floriforme]KAH8088048.1 hypothetical protein HD553DRAFT_187141 [Filobasidium floriforme]